MKIRNNADYRARKQQLERPWTRTEVICVSIVAFFLLGGVATCSVYLATTPSPEEAKWQLVEKERARWAALSPEERRAEVQSRTKAYEPYRLDRRDAEIEAAGIIICAEIGDCPSGMTPREARQKICDRTGDC